MADSAERRELEKERSEGPDAPGKPDQGYRETLPQECGKRIVACKMIQLSEDSPSKKPKPQYKRHGEQLHGARIGQIDAWRQWKAVKAEACGERDLVCRILSEWIRESRSEIW
jgi:hypothetical protein